MVSKIGVSVVSLLPHSWGPGGLLRAYRQAQEAEIDYLQLVPFFGYSEREMRAFAEKHPGVVLSFEGDWRRSRASFGTMKMILSGRDISQALNFPLFGSLSAVERKLRLMGEIFPEAHPIDEPLSDSLTELKPEKKNYFGDSRKAVVDTYHLWEGDDETRLEDPEQFVRNLVACGEVKLIHFQERDREELRRFFGNLGSKAEKLLVAALPSGADVIIEINPLWVWRSSHILWLVKEHIKEEIENITQQL